MKKLGIALVVAAALAMGLGWYFRAQSSSSAPTTAASSNTESSGRSWPARPGGFDNAMSGARWVLGMEQVHTLNSTRVIQFTPEQGQAQTINVTLSGRWTSTVVELTDDDVLLHMALKKPSLTVEASDGSLGQAERDAALKQIGAPFYLRLSRRGKVQTIYLDTQLEMFPRSLLQGLVAATQYVESETNATTWETEEADTTGMYASRYERVSDRRVRKENLGYVRMASAGGMVPLDRMGAIETDAEAQFVFSGNGAIEHMDGHDHVLVKLTQPRVTIDTTARWELDLERVAVRDIRPPVPDLRAPAWESFALAEADLAVREQKRGDQQLLGGAGFEELLAELRAGLAADGRKAPGRSLERWAALLRMQPETADKIPALVTSSKTPDLGRVLIGALGSAETPEAQRALQHIVDSPDAPHENYLHGIAALGMLADPQPETVALLQRRAADSDEEISNSAVLALGTIAGSQGDSLASEEKGAIVDQLIQKLASAGSPDEQALYLEALGNTRDPRAGPAIEGMLTSEWPHVRGAAVRALRFFHDARIDERLLAILFEDDNIRVRADVLFAFSFRPIMPLVAVLRPYLEQESVAALRRDTILLVGSYLPELGPAAPEVLELFAWVVENDADTSVREAGQTFLP